MVECYCVVAEAIDSSPTSPPMYRWAETVVEEKEPARNPGSRLSGELAAAQTPVKLV